jgi:hypothetical protein
MRLASLRTVALLSVCLLASQTANAAGILDQLPADATGFVAIHDLAATSAKIERVTAIFKELTPGPVPPPLAIAQGVTGIGPGLDESGDALLALMPGDDAPLPPRPLLLLPVSDYAALAESIGGDATGEICRVTLAGEEVLLAKRGDFAAIMNVEHRDDFEKILAASPTPIAELAPLESWLATTDVSAGLTRSGVERLIALSRRSTADFRQQMEANFADPALSEMMNDMRRNIELADKSMEFLGAEVKAGAIGLTIDDATNVRLAKRVIFTAKDGESKMPATEPPKQSPLSGFASAPYVIGGGGPIPAGYGDRLAALSRQLLQNLPQGRGYTGFEEEDWQQLEKSYRQMMKGLTSIGFVLYEGQKADGVLSNYYFTYEVEDSQAYLKQFRESMEINNELMAKAANDLLLEYKLKDVTIADKPALEAVADVVAAGADPNVAMVEPMLKAMFGADGKVRMYAVAVDADTVLMAVAPQAAVAKAVEAAASGVKGLAEDEAIGVTAKLLDPQAPWTGFVNPAGAASWGRRFIVATTMAFAVGDAESKTPAFPATPPLGFSVNFTENQLQSEVVAPVKFLEGVAEYAEKLKKGE